MIPSDVILQTERLLLTRMRPAHVPALVDLWTDPDVTRYMGGPRERLSLESDLEQSAQNPAAETHDLWPLLERKSGKVVGHCGLLDKDVEGTTEIEVVYVLATQAWGKGYATEIAAAIRDWAFSTLGLKRLISLIEPSNRASERVAVKIGMRLEREIIRPEGALRRMYAVEKTSLEPSGGAV
jgi:ribosomal-protein-alanine N-acetyltransferase